MNYLIDTSLSAAATASGVTPTSIRAAHERIREHIHQTPLLHSTQLDALLSEGRANIQFKCEAFQRTGSFKIRGALNALSLLKTSQPIVCHSSGNHAQAIACAAKVFEHRAIVVIPQGATKCKLDAVKEYGAEIVRCKNTLEARARVADEVVREVDGVLVHPYLNRNVVAGQGTVGLEILQQAPDVETVIVPIGGGGLIGGIALAIKSERPDIRIVGAEPENVAAAARSMGVGERVGLKGETVADGLKASLGEVGWEVVRRLVDEVVTVEEDEILQAMHWVWSRLKVVIEPCAAVGVAAVKRMNVEGKVVVVLCGGNVDVGKWVPVLEEKEV